MLPEVDNNHVAEANALLTSMYVSKPVITGILKALTLRLQDIETSFWSMINAVQLANHPMAGGPWDVLDKLGFIVGVKRNGLADKDFLALIKLAAKVNRSRGRPEDVLQLLTLMSSGPVTYLEAPPAALYLGAWNIFSGVGYLTYPIFTQLLTRVRPAGVYALFHYSTWPDGNDFEWSSRYDSSAGQGKWGSRYDASVGGLMVAADFEPTNVN